MNFRRGRPSILVALLVGSSVASVEAQIESEESEPAQPEIVDGEDYRVFDRNGNPSSLQAIVSASLSGDVLLVGEEHDDMIGHAFQTALVDLALKKIGSPQGAGRPVLLSLEMFERDVQYVVDEYLQGLISESHFLRSSRPWDDYETRYRPAVEAAREHDAPVIASNAPRRYVNRVSGSGPESLSDLSETARSFLPPLPYPGPSDKYRAQWDALMAEAMAGSDESMSSNIIYSQALWDAAMGHAITEALVRHIGGFVVHFAGSFHVERGTGIMERIADYRPGTRVTSVVMTKVDDIDAWSAEDHGPLADYVVLTKQPKEADPSWSARQK
ncbi:MAG: ChaN family lipoprotein [Longimicrobiales bacterium]|nr:ChaN family lipoprotein [Longimicrobiales bacterium]